MVDRLYLVHICAVCFWFGLIGAEAVIERSRTESRDHGFSVARNHFWIDLLLELPVAVTVLASGMLLLGSLPSVATILVVKIAAGVFAVGINLYCARPVVMRKMAADNNDLVAVIRYSQQIDQVAVWGIPAGIVALVIGVFW